MPIVRIDFLEGKAPEYGVQVGLIVARALTDVLNVPKRRPVPDHHYPCQNRLAI